MPRALRLPGFIDPFTLLLVGTVALAAVLPCRGQGAVIFGWLTQAAITLLFFLHGAKLSREAILAGLGHWRLHLLVLASTFILFPLLGLSILTLGKGLVSAGIMTGLMFLCLLPSTVQSSIALTAIARGNVPAAVCSATLSNMIGIVLTPLLVGLFLGASTSGGGVSLKSIEGIGVQLLLPFVLGHLSRPVMQRWIEKHKALTGRVDRGSILMVVYTAFSAAVVEGLFHTLSPADLAIVLLLSAVVLTFALTVTAVAARKFGFARADEIAIVFCGSKKSLASGVPMAGVLFPAAAVGPIIVPLLLFHQMQLMVCAVLARRYEKAQGQA